MGWMGVASSRRWREGGKPSNVPVIFFLLSPQACLPFGTWSATPLTSQVMQTSFPFLSVSVDL